MGFTIPNEGAAGHATQAEIDQLDITELADHDRVVLTGCAVTERGAGANMSVDVAAGVISINGQTIAVAGGNEAIAAADATHARFDLVTVNAAANVSVTAGTPNLEPEFPTAPANEVILAAVRVPATDTTIETAQIVDKRKLRTANTLWKPGIDTGVNATWVIDPALPVIVTTGTRNPADDHVHFALFTVDRACTLTGIGCHVLTGSGGAGHNARLGVYRADPDDWEPAALLLDAGEISTTASGTKTITGLTTRLDPGAYWTAITFENDNGGALQLRTWQPGRQYIDPSNFANFLATRIDTTNTYGALDNPAAAWVDAMSSSHFATMVALRIAAL